MDTQEILSKIAKLKKAVESESDPDVKASYNKKIATLEAQVAEAEAKVEKKEEKAAAQEQKTLSEADEKIKKLEKALAAESDPDVKARYQKKLNELKGTLKDVKEEIKEEKKEIAEQKKEIKKAVKEVKSVQKEVRKTAIKKAAKKKVERKQVERKKTKRKAKLEKVMSDLDAMIERNKKLKAKYGSGYKGTGKPTDLERDAGRKAKPFGYRFVGKHDYRVPTEMQIKRGLKRGTIDYEARPNRADVNPDKKVKLADGGVTGTTKVITIGEDTWYLTYIDPTHFYLSNSPEFKGNAYHIGEFRGKEPQWVWNDVRSWLKSNATKMADGGMMKRGGKVGYTPEDKARFAKPAGWRWKDSALEDGIISRRQLATHPSSKMREEYPDYVYYEDRLNKADKKPTRTSAPSFKKGGKVGKSPEDRARFAKPAGWRWKDEAVEKGIIRRRQLSMQPSKKMRDKYPDLVYFEDRLNKADKNPTRTSADSI